MKRVYLDQNKWIDFAKAVKAKPGTARYQDALTMATSGVRLGQASFVLSDVHYRETSRNKNARQRRELAALMLGLSRKHAIAPMRPIVRAEIDLALHDMFDRPRRPEPARVFGVGVGHAVGERVERMRLAADLPIPAELRWRLEEQVAQQLEWVALAGMPEEVEAEVREITGIDLEAHAASYAVAQEEDRQRLQHANWHKGERGVRRAYANTLSGFLVPVLERLEAAGVPADALTKDMATLTDFCERVPMIYVDSHLERVQNASCRRWEPNDLNDLDALMRAGVYCDIVVGEKHWINVARQAGLGERYDTELLTSLEDLPVAMVG